MTEPSDASGSSDKASGTTEIPLFPLQTVLLPGASLPLSLFEPRYRQLAVDLMTEVVPNREFGVIAIKASLDREIDRLDHVYEIGCVARLREAERLADGGFDVITTGERRFRLLRIDKRQAPYLMATVRWLPDESLPSNSETAAKELSRVARAAHQKYCEVAWKDNDWIPPPRGIRISELSYRLAADCLLTLKDYQALLEETHPLRRLKMVSRFLNTETGFLTALRSVPLHANDIRENPPPSLN